MTALEASNQPIQTATDLTVAILTYRRPEYLAGAIESVLAQSVAPRELLIVDDGSDAPTGELVEHYRRAYPSLIRYVWRENGGHSPARNTAVAECRTDYILWLDDDDTLTPNAVESQWAAIQAHPEADVIYGKLLLCDEELRPLTPMASHSLDGSNKLHLFFKHNPVPNPGTVAKRTLFERVGGYDSTFRHAEDYDLWSRAASAGAVFYFNDSIVCNYRSHPGNLATAEKAKRAAHERVWVVERLLGRHNIEDIFAHLDWSSAPHESLGRVCFEIAELVSRFGGHDSAADALTSAKGVLDASLLAFLKRLLEAAKLKGVEGIRALRADPLYRTELSQRLVTSLLEFHCTDAERDRYHVELWKEELGRTPLRQLFPQLPWDAEPIQAAAVAHGAAAGYFVMHGAFSAALEVLARAESGVAEAEQQRARELLEAAALGPVADSARWLSGAPQVATQFLHMLKLRDQRYQATGQRPPLTDEFGAEPQTLSGPQPLPDTIVRSLPLLRRALQIMQAPSGELSLGDLDRARPYELLFEVTPTRTFDVAVVIPTFNRPELVELAVRSALLQPLESLQVVVVNDAGAELSETLRSAWQSSGRVTYLRHRTNSGLGASRNTGIAVSSARYVIVLDDDDELIPGALALLLRAAMASESLFITGDHLRSHYDDQGARPSRTTYHQRATELVELLGFENGIVSGSALIARELLCAVGGYCESLHVHEDYDLHLRLSARAEPRYLPIPIMNYHLRSSIGRMNNDRRLYWFATAAFNHQQACVLFGASPELSQNQREAQYAHVERALHEGATVDSAGMLVGAWLQALSERGLKAELESQVEIISRRCPQLVPAIHSYMQGTTARELGAALTLP